MKQNLITDVVQGMLPYLNNAQTEKLQEVLQHTLFGYEVTKVENDTEKLRAEFGGAISFRKANRRVL